MVDVPHISKKAAGKKIKGLNLRGGFSSAVFSLVAFLAHSRIIKKTTKQENSPINIPTA